MDVDYCGRVGDDWDDWSGVRPTVLISPPEMYLEELLFPVVKPPTPAFLQAPDDEESLYEEMPQSINSAALGL